MKTISLVIVYCVLVFIFSWSIWLAIPIIDSTSINFKFLFFDIHLATATCLTILGSIMPGVIALTMTIGVDERSAGRALLKNFVFLRFEKRLYFAAFFIPIVINLVVLAAQTGFGVSLLIFSHLKDFLRLFLANILLTPLWEELGWRGFLLPKLSSQMGLGKASLIIGVVWASWHFVLYKIVFHVSTRSFLISFATITAMSVVLAILYSKTQSLILPILFHASWNAATNWIVTVQSTYDLYPVLLEAIAMWACAGAAWYFYRDIIKRYS